MHLHRALWLITLLGCSSPTSSQSSSSSSSVPAGSSTTGPALCEKADKLQKRLASIDAKASRVGIGPDIVLPESKDGAPVSSMGAVVVIGAKDIRVNGTPVRRTAGITEQVQSSGTVLLALSKGTEAIDRLPEVVAAIGSEHQIYLLATLPGNKVEAPPKGLDVSSADDPSQRATIMAKALTKSIATCPEAKKVFERLSSVAGDGKGELVKKDLPAAVNACDCKVPDDLEDLMAYLLGGDQPVIGKKLNVSSDKGARAISLKGLDGQKLYDALPADGALVKLER